MLDAAIVTRNLSSSGYTCEAVDIDAVVAEMTAHVSSAGLQAQGCAALAKLVFNIEDRMAIARA